MKKIFAVIALSLFISLPLFAEENQKQNQPVIPSGMSKAMSMMPRQGGAWVHPMMMDKATMVATEKGGVIVLIGNKLMHYDADLNLVKEVEIIGTAKQYTSLAKNDKKEKA